MPVSVREADAHRVGSCNACTRLWDDPGGGRVLVVHLRSGNNGGFEVRLCPACRTELAQALR